MQIPSLDRRELAAIFVGGALGTLLRGGIAQAWGEPVSGWPWPTFLVNLSGAFLLGYFVTRLQEHLPLSTYRRPLLGTGFCGALTTFSTVQIELLWMLDAHRYATALAYLAASLAGGLAGVHLATVAVRRTGIGR